MRAMRVIWPRKGETRWDLPSANLINVSIGRSCTVLASSRGSLNYAKITAKLSRLIVDGNAMISPLLFIRTRAYPC